MCKFGDNCTRQVCFYRHNRDNFKFSKFMYNLHRIVLNKVKINPLMRSCMVDSLLSRTMTMKKNNVEIKGDIMAEIATYYA